MLDLSAICSILHKISVMEGEIQATTNEEITNDDGSSLKRPTGMHVFTQECMKNRCAFCFNLWRNVIASYDEDYFQVLCHPLSYKLNEQDENRMQMIFEMHPSTSRGCFLDGCDLCDLRLRIILKALPEIVYYKRMMGCSRTLDEEGKIVDA